jgi:hypothetical protein
MSWEDEGYVPQGLKPNLVQEVDAVGSGCILFNRAVVEGVRAKHGPPFVRTYDEDGLVEYGPDFYFCQRAKRLGYSVACDTRCPCDHFVEIPMFTATQRFGNA